MKSFIFSVFLLFSTPIWAESIELSSGEVLDGKIQDFPKELEIELTDGTKKKVPYKDITSIYKKNPPTSFSPFAAPKEKDTKPEKGTLDQPIKNDFAEVDMSKGAYVSPSHTFETWKVAALKDDIDGMANCYAASRKGEIKKQLKKITKKNREDMKMAMNQTIFTPSEPYYQGDYAIMEVTWTKGMASQTQTLKFTFENNKEWKIIE